MARSVDPEIKIDEHLVVVLTISFRALDMTEPAAGHRLWQSSYRSERANPLLPPTSPTQRRPPPKNKLYFYKTAQRESIRIRLLAQGDIDES